MQMRWDFEVCLRRLRAVRKMGMEQLLRTIPGGASLLLSDTSLTQLESEVRSTEAIICSMTPDERRSPNLIRGSRIRRIARGSGTCVRDVRTLLRMYRSAVSYTHLRAHET